MPTNLNGPMVRGQFRVTQQFKGSAHRGVDLAAPIGTPFYSAGDGTVVSAGPASGFGLWIVIDHNTPDGRFSTVYGHNNENLVRAGQAVRAGQQIGTVGNRGQSTGPHLHFEVWKGKRLAGGTAVNPWDYVAGDADSRPDPETGEVPGGTVENAPTDVVLPGWIEDTVIGDIVEWVNDFINFVENPTTWVRAGLFLAGALLLFFGLWSMFGKRTVIDLRKLRIPNGG